MIYGDEILKNVKMLLGIDGTEKDGILNFIIEDAVSAVLAHCRLEFLPEALTGIVAQMAAKGYRLNGYGSEDVPTDIKSVSEGDRSISFEKRSGNGIIDDYKARLAPFVNRRGRVPSEVDDESCI